MAPLLAGREPDRLVEDAAESYDADEEDAQDDPDNDAGADVDVLDRIVGELAQEEGPAV